METNINKKYYVSLEVAQMLKSKGYNLRTDYVYSEIDGNFDGNLIYHLNVECLRDCVFSPNYVFAPTLLEALDWVEERNIRIEIHWNRETGWLYLIRECDTEYMVDFADSTHHFTDRNECINAALNRALKFVK